MKLKNVKVLMSFFLIFTSLLLGNKDEGYEKYVNQIIKSFSKEMEKEHGLICIGSGGKMPHDVEEIEVLFIAYKKATIEQARELEVKATEKLIKAINNHEKIRPFLREFPFKADRAEVSISFRMKNEKPYPNNYVARVTQFKNRIYYRAEDPNSPLFISLLEEPYEEALKLLEKTQK